MGPWNRYPQRPWFVRRPNVVLIVGDDVGYGDLSCYGRTDYQTPSLDALAAQGLRFTHAYAASPMCTPSRCGLMTGRYPGRQAIGLREPLLPHERDIGLEPADHPTIASRLKTRGYATSLVGKWHLGYADPGAAAAHGPLQFGFDRFYGIMSYGVGYFSHLDAHDQLDLWNGAATCGDAGYVTDLFSNRAVAEVQTLAEPFFLCLSYTAPHFPWQGPNDSALPSFDPVDPTVVPAGTYAAMMQRMDAGIGQVMAALAARGIEKDTLVIFTSDNGGALPLASHGSLRGSKMGLLEGGIRVPAIVRWPRKALLPGTTSQVAWSLDWMPTILAATRTAHDAGFPLDGINLLPRLASVVPVPWHRRKWLMMRSRTLYWRVTYQHAVRRGYWKYLRCDSTDGGATAGQFLYNLRTDPGESTDVSSLYPGVVNELQHAYANWETGMLPY